MDFFLGVQLHFTINQIIKFVFISVLAAVVLYISETENSHMEVSHFPEPLACAAGDWNSHARIPAARAYGGLGQSTKRMSPFIHDSRNAVVIKQNCFTSKENGYGFFQQII